MEALKKNYLRFISLKQAKKVVILLIITFLFDFYLFSLPVLAGAREETAKISQENSENFNFLAQNIGETTISRDDGTFASDNLAVKSISLRLITAYNSETSQTDDSPCITANGFNLCQYGVEDTIAANFLPFGAKVRIPELFGERIFTVRDRMHSRHYNRIDIWMADKDNALQFGVKSAKIEILE